MTAWNFVFCGCCVGSDICDGLINRSVCQRVRLSVGDLETSTPRRPRPDLEYYATGGRKKNGADCTSTSNDNPHQVHSSTYFLSLGCQYSRQHTCSQILSTFVPVCDRSSSTPIKLPPPPQKWNFILFFTSFDGRLDDKKRLN